LLTFRHGLRASEVCNLKTTDIDLKNGSIVIARLKGSLRTLQAISGRRGEPTRLRDELISALEFDADTTAQSVVVRTEVGGEVAAYNRGAERNGESLCHVVTNA